MPKTNLKNAKNQALHVVETQPKTKYYNDIDLNNWKLYSHVKTGTMWDFSSRDKSTGHSYDYHGNFIPQIATQLFERFTKKNDIVLDLFFGSGTSGIEA
jgi:DNA modification methylase